MMDISRFGKVFPVRMVQFQHTDIAGGYDKGSAYYTAFKYTQDGIERGVYVRFRGFAFPSFCGGFVVHSVQTHEIIKYGTSNPGRDYWGTNVFRDHETRASHKLDEDFFRKLEEKNTCIGLIHGGLSPEGVVFFDYDYVMARLPDLTPPEGQYRDRPALKYDVAALTVLAAAAQSGRRGVVWADYISGPTFRTMRAMETLDERWEGETCLIRRPHVILHSRFNAPPGRESSPTVTDRESSIWRSATDIPVMAGIEEWTTLSPRDFAVRSSGAEFVNSNSGSDVFSGTNVLPRLSFLYQNQPFRAHETNGVNPDSNYALDTVIASSVPWSN